MTTHLSFAVLSRVAPSEGTHVRREWAREGKSVSVDRSVSKQETQSAQGRRIAHGASVWAGLLLVSPALWLGSSTSSLGQATPAPQPAERADEGVSAHYKLIERYATTEDPAKPDQLVQYQVGTREITKVTREQPQGAPEVSQTTFQTIYTERVGKLGKGTSVSDTVRRYDRADLKTTLDIPRYKTKLLQGLTVLYRPRPHLLPSVQCLVPGRQLREHEYIGIAYQVFLPSLSAILPRKPCRMGDSWLIAREAVAALVGKMPEEEDYEVNGRDLGGPQEPAGSIAHRGHCRERAIRDRRRSRGHQRPNLFHLRALRSRVGGPGAKRRAGEERKSGLAAGIRRPNGGRLRREGLDHQGLDRRGTHHGDTRW